MKVSNLLPGASLLLVLGLGTPVVGAEQKFTLMDVARTRHVVSAEISPDGRQVAYLLSVPRQPVEDENGLAWRELHLVDTEGRSRPFVTGQVTVSDVSWTPNGRGISFTAKRGADKDAALYVIPADGGEARQVLGHDTGIEDYAWHPQGAQVAFLAKEKTSQDEQELKDKGFDQNVYEEQGKPTRVWIAEVYGGDRHWLDTDRLGEPRLLEVPGSASAVRWSPDGAHLAVALAPTSRIDDQYMKRRIHVLDGGDGRTVVQLEHSGKLGAFEWSPDGRNIALISADDIHDPSPGRLRCASVPDGSVRDLLPDYPGHVTALGWRDADTIMYLGDQGLWTGLGRIGRDGSSPKVIVPPATYSLSDLTLSRDGSAAAFLGDSPTFPPEVWFMRHGDEGPRRLTHSNPWITERRLAPQEVVTYTSRDGLEIQGLLIAPLDRQAGRRYPLVIVVHGGPESHYRNGWLNRYSRPGQALAAEGFAVFYPNYRGSTGRGVAFSKMGQADYAGAEFDDLIDGLDHLVKTGLVDADKVAVIGGSYGGFAAAWCATYHSERFAAAVMFAGVSDHVSKFGTTDIPQEMYLVHARKWPWDDWELFRQRSPLAHFQKCRTPLLIIHGQQDTRIDPSQSMELYRYLKTYGKVPVRLVLYPTEGHGHRKAAARYDHSVRVIRWLKHYLQGPGGDPPPHQVEYDAGS